MNARLAYSLNSQFGPPSEPIDISKFVQDASAIEASAHVPLDESEESLAALTEECRHVRSVLILGFPNLSTQR